MAALRAGLPVTVPGMTMDRQCSSGLMTIATAAKQVIVDRMDVIVAGGVESISLVQTPELRVDQDPGLVALHADAYMPMLDTAETVAARYGISREACDLYALASQYRAAAAQQTGRFDGEITPVTTMMRVVDKQTGAISHREITLERDEGVRPETTLEGLAALKAVRPGGVVTAGNASQLSDGALGLRGHGGGPGRKAGP
ncbi:Acetyl-CoA acetyltransferase [Aphelenchoides fujianensis]|nr:Acetyl-CoA acetyltransferase [Aphelenchoides fujianensis]